MNYTLWGRHLSYCGGVALKLTKGSLRHCRAEQARRVAEGWLTAVYLTGDAPLGLQLMGPT